MKRVLFIEDDKTVSDKLIKDFRKRRIKVIHTNNFKSAKKAILNDIPFDAVILDWFFGDNDDSTVSRTILKLLYGIHFKPIFIYTNNKGDFDQTPSEELFFPSNLITCVSKDCGVDILKDEISKLINKNKSLKIAEIYRVVIRNSVESILFQLNEIEDINIESILKVVYGDGNEVDWSNDFILNLVHKELISNEDFTKRLSSLLKTIRYPAEQPNTNKLKKIANKILYYSVFPNFIHNGDIIKINEDETLHKFGIVITPECDLAQMNTRFIELVELISFNNTSLKLKADQIKNIKKYKEPSFFYFPSIFYANEFIDFIAILKSKMIIKETEIIENTKYPDASKRLLYSQKFVLNGNEVSLEYLCSKTLPYKSEFLQKLQSVTSRVGIPEIHKLL